MGTGTGPNCRSPRLTKPTVIEDIVMEFPDEWEDHIGTRNDYELVDEPIEQVEEFGHLDPYPFHEACWRMLVSRTVFRKMIAGDKTEPRELVRALVHHLSSLFNAHQMDGYGLMQIDHTFGGASQFRRIIGLTQYSRGLPEHLGFLAEDPLSENPLTLAGRFPNDQATKDWTMHWMSEASEKGSSFSYATDPFRLLPLDIIYELITSMASTDVCNLRLASRTVATLCTDRTLPQAFWKSRFTPGFEMEFILAGSSLKTSKPNVNWGDLYKHLRAQSNAGWLRNKRRIWECLERLCGALDPLMACKGLTWPQDVWTMLSDVRVPVPRGRMAGEFVNSRFTGHYVEELLLFPDPLRSTLLITASFIRWPANELLCISGFRVHSKSEDGSYGLVAEAGVFNEDHQQSIDVEPEHRICWIRAYLVDDAVVAVAFFVDRNEENVDVTRLYLGDPSLPEYKQQLRVGEMGPRLEGPGHLNGLIVRTNASHDSRASPMP